MNANEITNERLLEISNVYGCHDIGLLARVELERRKTGEQKGGKVEYWRSGSIFIKVVDGVMAEFAGHHPYASIGQRFGYNSAYSVCTAAEYEAAKANTVKPVVDPVAEFCHDCGQVHKGNCCNTSEVKENIPTPAHAYPGLNPEGLSDSVLDKMPEGARLLECEDEMLAFDKSRGELFIWFQQTNEWRGIEYCENDKWTHCTTRPLGWWRKPVESAHSPDCAVAVKARHECSCGVEDESPADANLITMGELVRKLSHHGKLIMELRAAVNRLAKGK